MFLLLLACAPDSPPPVHPPPATFEHWLHAVPDELTRRAGAYHYEDVVQLPADTLAATIFARTRAHTPGCLDALTLGAADATGTTQTTADQPHTPMRLLRHAVAPAQLREPLTLYVDAVASCEPGLEVVQLDLFVSRGPVR
jgi:hypothetical protein